ncbi:MAG TPA: DNA mismatch repair protein MutS [Candidatus Oscillibacter excrementigallinarum]|uniref:DNA mismatch repair protein MutS n=1 Tax=Candidatus Oscillibacter excrementigallinarum TaxID=2838716 RepID=A0A9D2RSM1_9FIRM|nr:DNA mismatch repair protein MutS [Candidatus Oscillibacter excrementigallinarum]
MAELTPMMKQYLEIKKDNPDSILFFRLGDFYEMFADDAKLASKELDLTLTSRDHGKHAKPEEERVPMCGIPYHASEAYIARLIAKGYKVAICEQMEDPATAKGLVKRDIIRVVTPGTVIDAACLEDKSSNFLCGIYMDSQNAGVAFCDISTGKTHLTAFDGPERVEHVINELGRFSPAEAVVNDGACSEKALTDTLTEKFHCRVENGGEGRFRLAEAEKHIRRQFGEEAFDRLPRNNPAAAMALGGLLNYLYETQKTDLSHINDLDYYEQGRFMELDLTARRNLELTETLRGQEKKGSLLWVLDKTRTPMGGRLLRSWLERPLLSVTAIVKRNAAVAALVENTIQREELIAAMTGLGDMERLIGRIVYGTAGGRDMVSLRSAIERLPVLREQLAAFSGGRLAELAAELDDLTEIGERIGAAICDEPPFSVREGGFIRDGYHEEVDRLRRIMNGGKGVLAEIEAKEKEKTGIRTLKIGYNKVFGYYIEVSNSFKDQVPDTYIRKQTLVNGERYITQELKDLEHEILTASDRVVALEYELFTELRQAISAQSARIQRTAAAVAEVDALVSFAAVAVRNHYCRPTVDESGVIEIHDGRHPVVEQMLKDSLFVPNDTFMGEKEDRVAIITGPNMAGKSTYMRQVALIVLMAQMGSFVPAASARIGVVDRIFTRIGASDDLSAGKSTFMVEMTEVADILRHATRHSLLILDEIGRGTSTFDGMSIARAVLEYCADKKLLGAKTLFATHYHELTELENTLPGTVNYNIAVKTRGEDIIFLRKILLGGADRSYGIEVAKLAGLPDKVVQRAKTVLKELEEENGVQYVAARKEEDQVSLTAISEGEVLDALRRCQVETLTPLEAMNLIYEWKKKLS